MEPHTLRFKVAQIQPIPNTTPAPTLTTAVALHSRRRRRLHDPAYVEYSASANTDDGSCATLIVNGCTSSAYTEYNASANTDDGSCATLIVNGCTDPAYVEYSASANTDDGSCVTLVIEGCTDAADANYDPAANTDDGSCASNSCSSIEFDDYTYSLVEIGDQCWFAENLRTTVYADDSSIPEVTGLFGLVGIEHRCALRLQQRCC